MDGAFKWFRSVREESRRPFAKLDQGQEPKSSGDEPGQGFVLMPAYRDIYYTVVQGLGRNVWKWSVNLDTHRPLVGQAMTRAEAISRAERAIDQALAVKKVPVEPPKDR